MEKCIVIGCEKYGENRGKMCRRHARKKLLYGDPNTPDKPKGFPGAICKIEACGRHVHGQGLCGKHYQVFITHGSVHYQKPTHEEIYHSSYIKNTENECWPWNKGKDKNGYGKISIRGIGTDRAHRYGWILFNKKSIPKGMLVCHSCDNPSCQNPKHFFLGTPKDNMTDKISKGRLVVNPYKDSKGRFTFSP